MKYKENTMRMNSKGFKIDKRKQFRNNKNPRIIQFKNLFIPILLMMHEENFTKFLKKSIESVLSVLESYGNKIESHMQYELG